MSESERLISKQTLGVIKKCLTHQYTGTDMLNLLERHGFERRFGSTYSNKLQQAGVYLDHHDWTDADVVQKLFRLLEETCTGAPSAQIGGTAASDSRHAIIESLGQLDGYDWDGEHFSPRSSAALIHAAKSAERFGIEGVEKELARILASVESDPDDAITSAKCLMESACRAILADYGERPESGATIGTLTKATMKHLRLLPDQINNAARGVDAIKSVLQSMGVAIQGLAELRNLYGDAHGKGPGQSGLEPRHARMAATFAGALACFLMETHERLSGAESNRR